MDWKVGDKARVFNNSAAFLGELCLRNGDITTVKAVLKDVAVSVTDTVNG